MEREILTVQEAADILRASPEYVEELLNSDALPGRLVDGQWRTTLRSLVSYVDGVPVEVACCTPDGACCTPTQMATVAGKDSEGGCGC